MSPAERKRRSRELQRASGVKEFSMQLEGLHLEYVEKSAIAKNTSASEALREILESALDRFVGIVRRAERMLDNGATDEEAAQFMSTHLIPPLPPMPDLVVAAEPKLVGASDAPTIMGSEGK